MIPINDIPATRKRCLESFYEFCQIALEMPVHEEPHLEMCQFLADDSQRSKLLLVPRDTWKTSIGSTAFPLWMVLRAYFLDKNSVYRVLIDSSTVRLSQFVLEAIANYVKNGENFHQLFGSLYDKSLHKENYLSLNFNKNRSGGIREPNFLASGVNAAKTGLHFDLISLDDVVTKENVMTVAQREKVFTHYRMMYGILESSQGGQRTLVHVIGTRYHDDDLYGRIIKQDKKEVAEGNPAAFATMIRAAEEDGKLFYPAVLTHAELAKKRAAMLGLFFAQYMNDPNKENAPFKLDQLRFIPITQFPEQLKLIRMSIDPCIKEEQIAHGDFNAIVVNGWSRFGMPYLLDVSLRRDLSLPRFLDLFFTMATQYNPEQIIIEKTTMSLLADVLQAEMIRKGRFFPIFWVDAPSQMGKETRWMKIQTVADRCGLHIADEIPEATKLEIRDQWCRAPFAQYDDFMDAMEMQFAFMPAAPDESVDGQERSMSSILAGKAEWDASARTLRQVYPHLHALDYESKKNEQGVTVKGSPEEFELAAVSGAIEW